MLERLGREHGGKVADDFLSDIAKVAQAPDQGGGIWREAPGGVVVQRWVQMVSGSREWMRILQSKVPTSRSFRLQLWLSA